MNKINLFIDLTGNNIILALFNKKQIFDTFIRETNKDMIEHIINDIKSFLNKNKLDVNQIKKIFWISNPGLYTGVRVGSLILKAWSTFNKNIKIYEINKLLFQSSKNCYSLLDAKGNKYYCANIVNDRIVNIEIIDKDEIKKLDKEIIIDQEIDFNNLLLKFKLFKKINIKKYHLKYLKDAC